MSEYEDRINSFGEDYKTLNRFVMTHTQQMCKENKALEKSIESSLKSSELIFESNDDELTNENKISANTEIIISKERTLECAKKYKGRHVTVLNFANNHSVGGAPYSAGAQEESMCRISTLYPCLKHYEDDFYIYHQKLDDNGNNAVFHKYGNNDIIYTPDVVVFKTDESAPKMLDEKDWYKVDVLTCAAPYMKYDSNFDDEYKNIICSRINKILNVAYEHNPDVLILGAWGCGAFGNSPEIVASTFNELLKNYNFKTVEYAVYDRVGTTNYDIFNDICGSK